jgi:hypothetical protein
LGGAKLIKKLWRAKTKKIKEIRAKILIFFKALKEKKKKEGWLSHHLGMFGLAEPPHKAKEGKKKKN